MWDSARRVVLVAVALSVLACSRTDPGISREGAEAILRARNGDPSEWWLPNTSDRRSAGSDAVAAMTHGRRFCTNEPAASEASGRTPGLPEQ
jgi:hypothetical protein